jgi:hypothetical protein
MKRRTVHNMGCNQFGMNGVCENRHAGKDLNWDESLPIFVNFLFLYDEKIKNHEDGT